MGETIDELDDPDAGRPERSEETTTAQPDTSGFDSMFPEDDLASIFDPDSSDDEPANEFDVEPDEPVPPRRPRPTPIPADRQPPPASSDADGPETPRSMSTASQPPIGTSRTPNRRRLISMTILRIRRTTGLKTRTTARRRQPASRQRSTTPPIPVPTPTPIPMALSPPMPTMAPMPNLIPPTTRIPMPQSVATRATRYSAADPTPSSATTRTEPTMTTGRCSTGARRMTTGRSSERRRYGFR